VLLTEANPPADHDYDEVWRVTPPFGPYPPALRETYPFTAETPARTDRAAHVAAAEAVAALADANPDVSFTLATFGWPSDALVALPDGVAVETLGDDGWVPDRDASHEGAGEDDASRDDGAGTGGASGTDADADADGGGDR